MTEAATDLFGPPQQDGWPEECLDCERRFGRYYARLYPLAESYGKGPDVETLEGRGKLLQVFEGRAMVLLDKTAPKKRHPGKKVVEYRPVTYMSPADIAPLGVSII